MVCTIVVTSIPTAQMNTSLNSLLKELHFETKIKFIGGSMLKL